MDQTAKQRISIGKLIAIFAMVLVLYCLSIGPVAWVLKEIEPDPNKPSLSNELFDVVYKPIKMLYLNTEMHETIDSYLVWWTGYYWRPWEVEYWEIKFELLRPQKGKIVIW